MTKREGEDAERASEAAREARVARPLRPGFRAVTPRMVTRDVAGLVAFIKHTFDASGELHGERPCELTIGDSTVMVSGLELREPHAAFLYVYVPDADATFARAVAAGATAIEAPLDTPYGDRRAMISDAWGNLWQIATYHAVATQQL